MTYPQRSHHPIRSLSLFSSYLAAPLFRSCLRVAPYLSVLWTDIVCLNKVTVYCFSFHLCNTMGCFQSTFQLYFILHVLAVFWLCPFNVCYITSCPYNNCINVLTQFINICVCFKKSHTASQAYLDFNTLQAPKLGLIDEMFRLGTN